MSPFYATMWNKPVHKTTLLTSLILVLYLITQKQVPCGRLVFDNSHMLYGDLIVANRREAPSRRST